jgi:hypothetical protein
MFPHGQTVFRDRARVAPSPHNPDRMVPAPIEDDPNTVELEGAWVASASSVDTSDAARTQTVSAKSLYLDDPDADVRVGDRIRCGGLVGWVRARPEAVVNPFTGWQPVVEIPLEIVEG